MLENELNNYIGLKMKQFRSRKKMTQLDLAKILGVSKSAVANYEQGIRAPKQDLLFKMADVFGVSLDEFFPEQLNAPRETKLEIDKGAGIEIHESMEGSLERQESYLISLLQVQNGILTELKQIRKYLEDKNNE